MVHKLKHKDAELLDLVAESVTIYRTHSSTTRVAVHGRVLIRLTLAQGINCHKRKSLEWHLGATIWRR